MWVGESWTTFGFKRYLRGLHERDWVMSGEDLQHSFVLLVRAQKLLSVKAVLTYINSTLFKNEADYLSRLLSMYYST